MWGPGSRGAGPPRLPPTLQPGAAQQEPSPHGDELLCFTGAGVPQERLSRHLLVTLKDAKQLSSPPLRVEITLRTFCASAPEQANINYTGLGFGFFCFLLKLLIVEAINCQPAGLFSHWSFWLIMCILDRGATSGAGAVPCRGIGAGQLACSGQAQPRTTRLRLLFVPFGVWHLGHASTVVGLCCPPENYKMAKLPSNRLRMPQQLAEL